MREAGGWRVGFHGRPGGPIRSGETHVITALLVDDESLIRAGLRFILESAPDLSVVAEAEDGDQAVTAVRRARPDVVLMDVGSPRRAGRAPTGGGRPLPAPPAVIVLTTFDTDDHVFRA